MSPTFLKLAIAATGVIAFLWCLPATMAAVGCKACADARDLPQVATGVVRSRRIR